MGTPRASNEGRLLDTASMASRAQKTPTKAQKMGIRLPVSCGLSLR